LEKLLKPLLHTQAVHYAEFSLQGDRFVTASIDGTAQLWDAVRRERVGETMQHVNAAVNTARFSPDGRYVVTAADNGAMRVWDGMAGHPISEQIYLASSVDDALFSANGRYLIAFPKGGPSTAFLMTAGVSERVGLSPARPDPMRLTASERDLIAGHPGKPTSFDRTPDGAKLAVAFPDNTVMIWDTRNRARTTEPLGHDALVNCVRFSPDGLRVVTSTADRMVRVWDTSTGFPLCDWIRSVEPVAEVGWCADGSCITTSAGWSWKVARMEGGAPEWLADLADALAGLGDPSGLVGPSGYLRVRQKILDSPDNGPIAQSVKAFLEDETLPTAP
jgi:WD40 repeat protein